LDRTVTVKQSRYDDAQTTDVKTFKKYKKKLNKNVKNVTKKFKKCKKKLSTSMAQTCLV